MSEALDVPSLPCAAELSEWQQGCLLLYLLLLCMCILSALVAVLLLSKFPMSFEVSYLQYFPRPCMIVINYITAFEKEIPLLILLRTLCLPSDRCIGLSARKMPAF